MQMKKHDVLIKKAYYEKESDSVFWEVVLPSGKVATLMWLREEFGPTFNIHADIPPNLVQEFCEKMVGQRRTIETPASVDVSK